MPARKQHLAKSGLSFRQEQFVKLFVACNSFKEAYTKAYNYKPRDPTRDYSERLGWALAKRGDVKAEIARYRAELARKTDFTREDCVRELGVIAQHGEPDTLRVTAMTQLSRMCGWDAPERLVVTADPLLNYMREIRAKPLNWNDTRALNPVCSEPEAAHDSSVIAQGDDAEQVSG